MKRRILTLTALMALSSFGLEATSEEHQRERRSYEGCLDKRYCAVANEECLGPYCWGTVSIYATDERTKPNNVDANYSGDNISNIRIKYTFKGKTYFVAKPKTSTVKFIKKKLKSLRVPEHTNYKGK